MSLEPGQDATAIARVAERLMRSLVGIDAATVRARADGSIDSIAITRARGLSDGHAVQNVRSALLAGLDIAIDPSCVLVMPRHGASGREREPDHASARAASGNLGDDELHKVAGGLTIDHVADALLEDDCEGAGESAEHAHPIVLRGATNRSSARSREAPAASPEVHRNGGPPSANGPSGATRNGVWRRIL